MPCPSGRERVSCIDKTFYHFHSSRPSCLCHGFMDDFGYEPTSVTDLGAASIPAEDYANFAQWIPRFGKPDQPCEYCRSRHLDCWFTFANQTACSPCNALFRPCSFSTQAAKSSAVMDTLHVVQEDSTVERGSLTGVVALKSWDRSGTEIQDDEDRPSRKTGTRFPRSAIKILKDWMDQHRDNPYPTEDEKQELKLRTGLNITQVSNWLANTRRRTKIKTPRGISPSIRNPTWPTTDAIDIPFDKQSIRHNGKTWDIMNPLERWQHSPPENEPAPISAIATAVANSGISPHDSSLSGSQHARRGLESSAGSSSFSVQRAPSITSLDTGRSESLQSSNSLSNLSLGSSKSHGSRNSYNSFGGGVRKGRRRRRTPAKLTSIESRPYQCTFCTDSFRTKYDWARHEKSLHLSLEKWICAPLGEVITISPSGQKQCVFCDLLNPTEEHLETHNYRACEEKGIAMRTFYRKDHLRQHLRLVHGCKMTASMESWKSEATYIRCRCGFCGDEFTKWQDRVDHLAKHFKAGARMIDWKGCRGLDPSVAAQVTNAMPPYLIATEAKTPFPFSASNESSMGQHPHSVTARNDHGGAIFDEMALSLPQDSIQENLALNQYVTSSGILEGDFNEGFKEAHDCSTHYDFSRPNLQNQTCWEVLTVRLGRFVREQMQAGIFPTDETIQQEARRILYESDDTWNQTAADNPEWLDLFKKAHGLGAEPLTAEEQVYMVDDLGVGIGGLTFDTFFADNGWDTLPESNFAKTQL